VREALRLLEEQDRLRQLRIRQLEEDIRAGVAELDRGASSRFSARSIKTTGRKRKKIRKR
jgi:antitoxin ParD1/3/4